MCDALKVPLAGWIKPVWFVLSFHAHEKGECWPSLETLELETGASKPTICRALKELERLGLISRDSPEGRTTTRYYVNCNAATQLTVTQRHTKESERKKGDICAAQKRARQDLEMAKVVLRRSSVKATFLALCDMYPEDVKITVPMIARELGARPAQVRSDIQTLIKNLDIPLNEAMRFGTNKRRPWHAGKLKNVVPFRQAAR